MQLDLKGGVKGEVSVVVTAAPFRPVTAVIDIHIQGDGLLLRHRGSWGKDGGRWRETGRQREQEKEKWMA